MGGSHTAYVHSQERSAGRLLECNVDDRQASACSYRIVSRMESVHVGMDTLPSSAHLIVSNCDMPYTRLNNGGGCR
jgi:hypothetical protein